MFIVDNVALVKVIFSVSSVIPAKDLSTTIAPYSSVTVV
jgi:hypothetical protein